jgi:hypothetical protein
MRDEIMAMRLGGWPLLLPRIIAARRTGAGGFGQQASLRARIAGSQRERGRSAKRRHPHDVENPEADDREVVDGQAPRVPGPQGQAADREPPDSEGAKSDGTDRERADGHQPGRGKAGDRDIGNLAGHADDGSLRLTRRGR